MRMSLTALPLLFTASIAHGADGYHCHFLLDDHGVDTVLSSAETGWVMQFEDGTTAHFSDLGADGTDLLRLVSVDFDPDASAVALVTVGPDNSAFVSVHGQFPTHDAAVYSGTCSKKDS